MNIRYMRPATRVHRSLWKPTGLSGRIVLVVEDEPAQRCLFATALRQAGLVVIEASNGDEALKKSADLDQLDLVVTDIRMPIMDGLELVDRLRYRFTDLRVLYVTGYQLNSLADERTFVMQKPFTHEALLSRVQTILREESPKVH
jgi:CheY-like chemotaxis protein